ncbi:MAG TPA: HAMP domain-containing sensor histidine kinase [Prolixibacteraceae bacterium]|jgi:two-component system phosphate regulon sensor histidine kinase PhoR|nr:HAMP domain-containing sensor histidine kinase [Prolixibacteraceae bacterium]HPR84838.1 HAMP domain-containing sensor histidine kinase [Prolixibacteraceae bacterium]
MQKIKIDFSKKSQRFVLTILAVASMLGLLLIQINWLMESIKMQESIFRKGVNMALQQTALNMAKDEALNTAMQNSIERDSLINSQEVFTQNIITRLDSTVQKELEFYHINLDFHFLLINGEDTLSVEPTSKVKNGELFHQSFVSPDPNASIDLAIHFPSRKTFIVRKLGLMFATSVLLILLTMAAVFIILAYYRTERRFAQQVKDMIGNLTHEFMTPISSISLAGNMIITRNQKNGDQNTVNLATAIKEENRKLQKQVDRLLQLAAVENSGFNYDKKAIDVHMVIDDAIHTMDFQIKQADAEIKCDYQALNSVVYADAMHLNDVFVNLFTNSIKYSTEKPVISLTTSNSPDKINITITDNGIGIPPKEYKRIFEKYYRISTGNLHPVKGFGIGLYYVKTVVAAHGGTIFVQSENRKGSTFTIILPLFRNK